MDLLQDYASSDDEVEFLGVEANADEVEMLDIPQDVPVVVIPNNAKPKVLKKIGAKKSGHRMVLKEHQVNVLKGIYEQPGMLAVHRTGSGKTLLGLAVRRQLVKYWEAEMLAKHAKTVHAVVVSPKKVGQQYEAEVKRLGYKSTQFRFASYEMLRNAEVLQSLVNYLIAHEFNVLIFDEAHRLTNLEADTTKQAFELASHAKFVLCATATPIVNSPFDLAPLFALVSNERTLPLRRKAYLEEFSVSPDNVISHRLRLEEAWQNLVSVYLHTDPSDAHLFPSFSMSVRKVKMSDAQFTVYKAAEDINKEKLKGALDVNGNLNEAAIQKLNSFLSQTRQLCNSVQKQAPQLSPMDTSPKLVDVVKYVKKGPKPAVIFSHFIESGIDILAKILGMEGLTFGVISGQTSSKVAQTVKEYNNGKLDALLLSVAGSEGLDLKGTRQIHVVEQPWTDTRLKQVIGRGIRYMSHSHLPSDQQNVDVVQWIAVKTPTQLKATEKFLQAGGFEDDSDSDSESGSSSSSYDDDDSNDEDLEAGGRRSKSDAQKRKKMERLARARIKRDEKKEKRKEKSLRKKAKEHRIKKDLSKKTKLPTADEILMIINNRKKELGDLFTQVLECASIETNVLGVRPRPASCVSPTRAAASLRRRKMLKLQDLMDEEE